MILKMLFKVLFFLVLVLNYQYLSSQTTRDPYHWPFAESSIWNTPIGEGAEYFPQPVNPDHIEGTHADLDVIILKPEAPGMNIYGTQYRWSSDTNNDTRCTRYNHIVHAVLPIPRGYKTLFYKQSRPNNAALILKKDGRTLFQTQPFQVCDGNYATSGLTRPYSNNLLLKSPDIDLYGDGRSGMHGGSGLNTMGGAIRLGELMPGSPPMRHALKISFPGEFYLHYDHEADKGYRWPALKHDSGAESDYRSSNVEAKIGCLRAIPALIDIDTLGLQTEAGRKLAWTLKHFGAYQVEGVPWGRMMICVEEGPEGSVVEEFERVYGWDFATKDKENNPWFQDCMKLMPLLHIISNNSETTPGGGGEPLIEGPPPFGRAGNLTPALTLVQSIGSKPDSVLIEAKAFDIDGAIQHVKFFIGDSLVGVDSVPPYNIYVSSDVKEKILAGALDNEGGYAISLPLEIDPLLHDAESQINISWNNNIPDTIDMGKPIKMEINASIQSGSVKRVDFYNGMNLLYSDFFAPYSYTIDYATDSFFKLSAKAISSDNREAYLAPQIVTVINTENDLPVVDMFTNSNTVINEENPLRILIETFDPDGYVKTIDLYLNNQLLKTSYKPAMYIEIDTLSTGVHEIRARCYDDDNGVVQTDIHTINVENFNTKISKEEQCRDTDFRVFPNPANNGKGAEIQFPARFDGFVKTVFLFDSSGRLLYNEKTMENQTKLPCQQVGSCIALVKISNNIVFSEKLFFDK